MFAGFFLLVLLRLYFNHLLLCPVPLMQKGIVIVNVIALDSVSFTRIFFLCCSNLLFFHLATRKGTNKALKVYKAFLINTILHIIKRSYCFLGNKQMKKRFAVFHFLGKRLCLIYCVHSDYKRMVFFNFIWICTPYFQKNILCLWHIRIFNWHAMPFFSSTSTGVEPYRFLMIAM